MFVFVYSSYHQKLSFPHLVILATLQTPKTSLVVLGIRRTGYAWHYLKYAVRSTPGTTSNIQNCFEYQKQSFLNQATPPPPKKKRFLEPKISLCLNSHPIHVFIATLHLYCSHNFIISAVESLGWDFYASYDENLNSLAFFKFSLPCCCCSVHNSHQQNKRTQKYIRVLENRLDKVTFRYIPSG